ncbi:hypothetical protein GC173_11420 [bacterium]|nr:hypothetical protein [bacterium]
MGNGTSPATTSALLAENNRLLVENIRLTKVLIREIRNRTVEVRRETLLAELELERVPSADPHTPYPPGSLEHL